MPFLLMLIQQVRWGNFATAESCSDNPSRVNQKCVGHYRIWLDVMVQKQPIDDGSHRGGYHARAVVLVGGRSCVGGHGRLLGN